MMNWSEFGKKLTSRSGILELMDDLGSALQGSEESYMLGGGNPAAIPEMNAVWRRRMKEILDNGNEFEMGLNNYDTPRGKDSFLKSMANQLRSEYGWDITPDHIAVTNGSQTAFFMLFNLLSGSIDSGRGEGAGMRRGDNPHQKILLPLMPEYIGYADQGIGQDHFVARKPAIELIGDHHFKYHVDFDSLDIGDDISAICVSRPTNPTGNVLSDTEMHRLDAIAKERDIPLLIDNAYGTPFPNIIFTEAEPMWNENIVLGYSLSKIGLPSTRTGILVARPEIIQAVSAVNAIMSLSNNTLGQMLTGQLIESGELMRLSRDVVRPFYQRKSVEAQDIILKYMKDIPVRIHVSEGALFLWLWFDHPDIDTWDLYERLKKRRVFIVPGKFSFFGFEEDWPHRNQCVRLNFARERDEFEEGIRRIADEVRLMLSGA